MEVPKLKTVATISYTGTEAVAGVWAFSLLTSARGIGLNEAGAAVALFWSGLTAGRVLFALIAQRASLEPMVRGALALLPVACLLVCVARSAATSLCALALLGVAAGPVFPSLMWTTPRRVGAEHADNAIGFQVAGAALGQSLLPAIVGRLTVPFGLEVVGPALIVASLVLFALNEAMRLTTKRCDTRGKPVFAQSKA